MKDPRYKPLQEKADGLVCGHRGGGGASKISSDSSGKEYAVRAKCLLHVGDKCTVHFPDHNDHESYMFHLACHKQTARIVGFSDDDVAIQMTSGAREGETITDVHSKWLIMDGTFVKAKHTEPDYPA